MSMAKQIYYHHFRKARVEKGLPVIVPRPPGMHANELLKKRSERYLIETWHLSCLYQQRSKCIGCILKNGISTSLGHCQHPKGISNRWGQNGIDSQGCIKPRQKRSNRTMVQK